MCDQKRYVFEIVLIQNIHHVCTLVLLNINIFCADLTPHLNDDMNCDGFIGGSIITVPTPANDWT